MTTDTPKGGEGAIAEDLRDRYEACQELRNNDGELAGWANLTIRLIERTSEAESELRSLRARNEVLEGELQEVQRAKYGTPCKCEAWIAACTEAEDRAEKLEAELVRHRQPVSRAEWEAARGNTNPTISAQGNDLLPQGAEIATTLVAARAKGE